MVEGGGVNAKRKSISTRIKNSTKPTFSERAPTFFRCPDCGSLTIQTAYRSSHNSGMHIVCCGKPVIALTENRQDELVLQHQPVMEVTGGYDANVAQITVGEEKHPMEPDHYIEWVYLYTFQGGQLKFLKPGQVPSVIFALAQEDSYVYCDRLNCMKCKFNCKRGFTAYAYCNKHGLWSFQK